MATEVATVKVTDTATAINPTENMAMATVMAMENPVKADTEEDKF